MVAHAYQQSVIETSKANPFVYTVQWRSAMEHNRTCLICEQRNGNIYPLDNVPMDHPNGLCTIFPVIQGSLKDVAGQLADWVNGNADERFDKKMDSYIEYLGFDPQKIRALTLAAGSLADVNLARSVFSVGAGVAGNVRNDINNADLGLTDGGESDIINSEMLRNHHQSESKYKYISDEEFSNLTIEARLKGANILRGTPEIENHLDNVNASASTIGDTLLFRQNVTKSEVLEETHHYMQNISRLNDDKPEPLRTYLNEIEAKQFLIDNSKKYKIPRIETEETEIQLNEYYKLIDEYKKVNGYE